MLDRRCFDDRPGSVCPGLIPFVWGYNDTIGDRRRQDLRRVAVAILGTRAPEPMTQPWADLRASICLDWARTVRRRRLRVPWTARRLTGLELQYRDHASESAGRHVGRAARFDRAIHAETLWLVERLAQLAPPVAPERPDPWVSHRRRWVRCHGRAVAAPVDAAGSRVPATVGESEAPAARTLVTV